MEVKTTRAEGKPIWGGSKTLVFRRSGWGARSRPVVVVVAVVVVVVAVAATTLAAAVVFAAAAALPLAAEPGFRAHRQPRVAPIQDLVGRDGKIGVAARASANG